ncbi:unnamed protein product [Lasius platythorax]|uniref:Uncharacterized protein n=1 Tax=Lasius platythorax TaxID=488582 RepID=A0AAV2N648_9HYME
MCIAKNRACILWISSETEALSSECAARFEDLEADTFWNWIRVASSSVPHVGLPPATNDSCKALAKAFKKRLTSTRIYSGSSERNGP